MIAEDIFSALNLAIECDGPGSLPCPEAMVGLEAYLCVDPDAYLRRCERRWEQDRYHPAAGCAVLFCTHNRLPLPEWLAEVVNEAMVIAFNQGGKIKGNPRVGGYLKQARQLEQHERRWRLANAYRLTGLTYNRAFQSASIDLRETTARGQPRQVRESYYKLQRQFEANTVKSEK